MTNEKMKTAVVYARYSSNSQTEQSIEGQLRVCQQYAQNNNIIIVDTYIDRAMTGTNDMRPAFQQMIKDSNKRAWDYVLVYKFDRFSRNKYESTIHKHTLKNNNVKVISATEFIPDSPEGVLVESLHEGYAAYYSIELSQKVRRGLRESYIKGNNTGGNLLYGYDVANRKNVINEQESMIVKEIFTKYSQGYTVIAIAKELKARGIRTKKGKYFTTTNLYKMLANKRYNGKVTHGDTVYDNIFPQIIDDVLWHKIEAIHKSNKHAPSRKKEVFDFLLSGKLVCGDCGHLMVGESGTSKTQAKHYYYTCLSRRRRKENCNLKSIKKAWLENLVFDCTWRVLCDNKILQYVANKICKLHEQQVNNSSMLKNLEAQKETALKASKNLISAIEMGIITEQTKIRLKELENEILQLDFDIQKEKNKNYAYLSPEIIMEYFRSVIKGDIDDVATKKAIVATFIREVILYPDKVIITFNFADTYEHYEITKDKIKEIEKQSQNSETDSIFTMSSNILELSPPGKGSTKVLPFFVT